MTDTRIHPVSGQALSRKVRMQTVAFGSLSEEVEVPGWYPEDDSDSIHSGRDLAKKEEVFQEFREAYCNECVRSEKPQTNTSRGQ